MSKPEIGKPPLVVRRAHRLIAADFHVEQRLTTRELCAWLGVSEQWAELGRCQGYGPPFERVNPKTIRYRVGSVLNYLKSVEHASTREYDTVERGRKRVRK
jgi:hypothetical protein